MKYFVDTCVFIYAASEENPYKESCNAVLKKIRDRRIEAAFGTEVVQEIVHFYRRKNLNEAGVAICWNALNLPLKLLPVAVDDVRTFLALASKGAARVKTRDFLHAAVMLNNGIEKIITVDEDFDDIPGIKRIPPEKV